MSGETEIIASTRDALNEVSPSFCLAKWLQVTIHLHTGHTHSCHHPSPHKIPLEEIDQDPGALHYTQYKMKQQQKMLDGERPSECQYCWNVEDLPGDYFSDRYMKSSDSQWAGKSKIDEIVDRAQRGEKINPSYVEVSFSNVCNFKCGYCGPTYSSQWVHEVEKHGGYQLDGHEFNDIEWLKNQGRMPIHHREHNPYVEAFWKWWPELVQELKVFRVTGGEPLLDKNTFRVMDELYYNTPNPNLELSFNSNLGVPRNVIDNYIRKINPLIEENKIRRSVLYTSVDAHGAQAEYGRHGLVYDEWLANLDHVLTQVPKLKVTIMCTANILSITSFERLLKDVYELKIKHLSPQRNMPITIDMSILRWPVHYCVSILPPEYADFMTSSLKFMEDHQENSGDNEPYAGFFIFEIEKMRRFIETIKQPINDAEMVDIDQARRNFVKFVEEHDRRRGTDFSKTFPELMDFYHMCAGNRDNLIVSS